MSILTSFQEEMFEERVVIMIYSGEVPRGEADALALADVLEHYPDNQQLEQAELLLD